MNFKILGIILIIYGALGLIFNLITWNINTWDVNIIRFLWASVGIYLLIGSYKLEEKFKNLN